MHLRTSRVSRHGRTYAYVQLVESYRRPDGMPAHRVIANLGDETSLEVQNLRAALQAARKSQRVVVARRTPADKASLQPVANLRYLDVAVLLEVWRSWGLDELLSEVMRGGEGEVSASSVVAALCVQRCVDPGSKLYATEWMPRTALPLLLPLPQARFNNTRVHRVLDELDAVTTRLMPRLVERYPSREGSFASLFMDVTDTWFVGHGPPLAERAKTKEGRIERKVSIVLLCNEQGYPMRWEVIRGRESEVVAMSRMLGLVAGLSWTQKVPLVCDRAMGRTAQIREMLAAGLHFVTALTRTEYDAYTDRIPHQALAGLEPSQEGQEQDIDEAARLIEAAGLQRMDEHLFVLDLGVVERVDEDSVDVPEVACPQRGALAHVMQLARSIDESLAAGRYASQASAGRALGLSKALVSRYRILRRLPESMQEQILDGQACGRALDELIRIARLEDAQAQCDAFAALTTAPARRPSPRPLGVSPKASASSPAPAPEPIRVRAVLYFNPQLFVEQRRRAQRQLHSIETFQNELNTRLASSRSRMQREHIVAAIDQRLRRDDLLEVFTTVIREQQIVDRTYYHVELQRNHDSWSRRRRYDGFNVLVAHPEVDRSAPDLCQLYRRKDVVEKDFQTIKSLVELRPVRHYTDAKVRAHVTVCMLALLLQQTLAHKLAGMHSAQAALEILGTTHLNRYIGKNGAAVQVVTRTDAAQDKILRRLRLQHLADYQETAENITAA